MKLADHVKAYGVPGDLSGYVGSTFERSRSGKSEAMELRLLPVSHGLSEFSERVSQRTMCSIPWL